MCVGVCACMPAHMCCISVTSRSLPLLLHVCDTCGCCCCCRVQACAGRRCHCVAASGLPCTCCLSAWSVWCHGLVHSQPFSRRSSLQPAQAALGLLRAELYGNWGGFCQSLPLQGQVDGQQPFARRGCLFSRGLAGLGVPVECRGLLLVFSLIIPLSLGVLPPHQHGTGSHLAPKQMACEKP